jgi:hypothetical protein
MTRYLNVRSTFAENNPAFASAREAIAHASKQRRASEFAFPDSEVLMLAWYWFSDNELHLRCTNGMSFQFTIENGNVVSRYTATTAEADRPAFADEEHTLYLRFANTDSLFEWHPVRTLDSVLGDELLDWYKAQNQYYLYFARTCIYLRTLVNQDTGAHVLFWTVSV